MRHAGDLTDRPWRKSRLAARILLRKAQGRMTGRDRRWARRLSEDTEVSDRLIQQGLYYLGIGHRKHELDRRLGIELTGHPTANEFQRELQNAVDLFCPSFEEESPNRYPENTRRLWRELWQAEIDIGREIVAPALARRQQGYGEPPPNYKGALREC